MELHGTIDFDRAHSSNGRTRDKSRIPHPIGANAGDSAAKRDGCLSVSTVDEQGYDSYLAALDLTRSMNTGGTMKVVLSCAFATLLMLSSPRTDAQVSMDTTRFGTPVPVSGDIRGLYKWVNSRQSDSADVTILSPSEGQRFKAGDSVFITVSVSGVAIGAQTQYADLCGLANSADGQHTHVILDNEPYLANYKSGQPFFVGLAKPGAHTLRVFASRSWHESIKSLGSFKTVTFFVDDTVAPTPENNPLRPGQPLLTYSRPKGEYAGEQARAIMVDFFLSNATLGPDGYKVRLTIDSTSTLLTEWVPYLVTGLKPGDHVFRLQLLTPQGMPVAGAFNTTARKVVVK